MIKKESDVIDVFSKFKYMVERHSGPKIKILITNGGGEYISSDFDALYEMKEFFMRWCHRTHLKKWECREKAQYHHEHG